MTRFTVALAVVGFAHTANAECTEPTGVTGPIRRINARLDHQECLLEEIQAEQADLRDMVEELSARVDATEVDIDRLGECGCEEELEVPDLEFSLDPFSPMGTGFVPGILELIRFNVDVTSTQDYLLESITIRYDVQGPPTSWAVNMPYLVATGSGPVSEVVSTGVVDDYGVIHIGEWLCDNGCEDTFQLMFDTSGARYNSSIAMDVMSATLIDEDGNVIVLENVAGLPVPGRLMHF